MSRRICNILIITFLFCSIYSYHPDVIIFE